MVPGSHISSRDPRVCSHQGIEGNAGVSSGGQPEALNRAVQQTSMTRKWAATRELDTRHKRREQRK